MVFLSKPDEYSLDFMGQGDEKGRPGRFFAFLFLLILFLLRLLPFTPPSFVLFSNEVSVLVAALFSFFFPSKLPLPHSSGGYSA